jgi:DNA polymerase IV (DinB-like DNA polymerase)
MDSFYASAEVMRNSSLKDKPVIIGAEPKDGMGRGVVVSCNYIARKYGVRSAMPISQAWKLCQQAIYLRPDFEYYESLSNQVMQIIKTRARKFEQVSIDEAFVDLSDNFKSIEDAKLWIKELKSELKEKTGLTCSVGLAVNKSTAKIATDLRKPDGMTVVTADQTKEFLAPLPIKAIPGVGVKTELILNNLNIKTIEDLQRTDEETLRRHLGKTGLWLWKVANGLESDEVKEHVLKSLSTEKTFEEDTTDWNIIERTIKQLSSELTERAKMAHLTYKKIGVKIRFQGFETHTREATLSFYTDEERVLEKEVFILLKQFRYKDRKIRLVGLKVSELRHEATNQASIKAWLEEKE